jgi:hypothetical protein
MLFCEQIKSKFLLSSIKKLSVTRLKDPIEVILTLKMHTGSRNLSYEILIKAACDSKFRRNFTAATL